MNNETKATILFVFIFFSRFSIEYNLNYFLNNLPFMVELLMSKSKFLFNKESKTDSFDIIGIHAMHKLESITWVTKPNGNIFSFCSSFLWIFFF